MLCVRVGQLAACALGGKGVSCHTRKLEGLDACILGLDKIEKDIGEGGLFFSLDSKKDIMLAKRRMK